MWKRLQTFADRLATHITLWQALGLGGLVSGAGVTAAVAHFTKWVDQYGPLGWWFLIVIGAILGLLVGLLIAWIRYAVILGGATRKWAQSTDAINPLDREFHTKRLSLQQLAHPVSSTIEDKRFIDCELLGPAVLFLLDGVRMQDSTFIECSVVVGKHGVGIPRSNTVGLRNVQILNSKVFNCIVIIPPDLVPAFRAMGAAFASLTGNKEIDGV